MPSIYDIKPAFQKLLRPLTAWLAAIGVTANEVTLFAAMLSAAAGITLALWPESRGPRLMIPVVLFVRMALNAIDGMLAREHNMKTSFGAVLNELGDVVADAALYLPFALIPGVSAVAVVLFVVLGIISEMAGVIGVQIGASRRYDGPMGKSDRAFALGLLALLLGCGVSSGRWTIGYVGLCDGLLAYTIYNRCQRALEELSSKR